MKLTEPSHHSAAPERSLGYLVNLSARLLAQALRARTAPDGMLPGQFPIALELLAEPGLTQRELCARIRIEQGTMASTLKRMERDGLIRRRTAAHDARQAEISLTPLGRQRAAAAVEHATEVNLVACAGLAPAAQSAFREALAGMIRNLDRDLENS